MMPWLGMGETELRRLVDVIVLFHPPGRLDLVLARRESVPPRDNAQRFAKLLSWSGTDAVPLMVCVVLPLHCQDSTMVSKIAPFCLTTLNVLRISRISKLR